MIAEQSHNNYVSQTYPYYVSVADAIPGEPYRAWAGFRVNSKTIGDLYKLYAIVNDIEYAEMAEVW